MFTVRSATVIQNAFKKTKLCPLEPPSTNTDVSSLVLMSAMQCASGKKAVELEVMGRDAMNIRDIVVKKASAMDILKICNREDDQSRALLIRSFAYNNMQKTLLKPIQEMKAIQQEHAFSKSIRVGMN